MAKAIIYIGYTEYVMDAEEALAICNSLAKAERYKRKYRSSDEGGSLHYVWGQDNEDELRSISILSDNMYRMAKLAGKPTEGPTD